MQIEVAMKHTAVEENGTNREIEDNYLDKSHDGMGFNILSQFAQLVSNGCPALHQFDGSSSRSNALQRLLTWDALCQYNVGHLKLLTGEKSQTAAYA